MGGNLWPPRDRATPRSLPLLVSAANHSRRLGTLAHLGTSWHHVLGGGGTRSIEPHARL